MKKLLLLLILINFSITLYAQNWEDLFEVEWENTYPGLGVSTGLLTNDSSYVLVINDEYSWSRIISVDKYGQENWSKVFYHGINSISQLNNKFILTGGSAIILLDYDGSVLWEEEAPSGSGSTEINSFSDAAGFQDIILVTGWWKHYPASDNYLWVVKYDLDGNHLDTYTYAAASNSISRGSEILSLNDSTFVIGGINNDSAYLLKIDQNGNEIWSHNYCGSESEIKKVVKTSDNNFVLATKTISSFGVPIYKVNENGNIIWDLFLPDYYNGEPAYISEYYDGSYLITGWFHGGSIEHPLIKISSIGEIQWVVDPGNITDIFWAKFFTQTFDNNMIIGGATETKEGKNQIPKLVKLLYSSIKAEFIADTTSGLLPLEIQFYDQTVGYPISWQWDFDNDGIINSFDQNPSTIFKEPGVYSVKLIVTDSLEADTLIKNDYITVNINSNPVISVHPDSLNFYKILLDSTSTLPVWVHNYGAPDLEVSNILSSTDKFTVSLPQTKDISFTVSSLDSQMVNIHFTPQDTVDYSANLIFFSNDPDNAMLTTDVYGTGYDFYADFGTDQTTGDVPFEVTFIDSSAGDIISWNWNFGDGDSSIVQNPVHIYQYDGVYDVSLTVEDNYNSSTLTRDNYITAIGHPEIYTQDSLGFDFGVVYLSDISGDSLIVIENSGTDTVIVSDISFINGTNGFHYSYGNIGNPLPPNCLDTIYVNFEPLVVQTYDDTLLITNNSENIPSLKIPLNGSGEYVPPASPDGLVIDIDGVNVLLSWNPVDSTIYGEPLTPDGYIIMNNEEPYDEDQFSFLGFTADTTYPHVFIAQYRDHMFYKVVTYKDFDGKNILLLNDLNDNKKMMSWIELKEQLSMPNLILRK